LLESSCGSLKLSAMKPLKAFLKNDRAARCKVARGELVAEMLAGAWRQVPTSPPGSTQELAEQELAEIATLLLTSGAGGLAWCKVRRSDARTSPAALELQRAYRIQYLHSALHERKLKQIIPMLRRFGVEPVLVKGWAIARIYPEAGMRPYCDLDLCVLPDHYAKANAVLNSSESPGGNVDLHLGFGKFYDRRTDDVFARSQIVMLDDVEVRVLNVEDHLRFLCMHLLRHGAVRPLWLCDIAVLLESRANNFDWDRCLSGSPRETDWVACAIALASHLLGVDVEGTPIARRARSLPGWLVPAVLRSWGLPAVSLAQVEFLLRHPVRLLRGLPAEISRHWPNPIEATMTLRGPFNRVPRLPFQVGHVVSRTTALFSQLLGDLGGAVQHRS